jgi:hypothetical protein
MDGSTAGTNGEVARSTANRGDASAAPASLQITYRPIGDLIPYVGNARLHSEAQVALIAGSIKEYGFTNPVLVDGANGIIAGHGRVLAARKLGLATVPTIELAHLTEVQSAPMCWPTIAWLKPQGGTRSCSGWSSAISPTWAST